MTDKHESNAAGTAIENVDEKGPITYDDHATRLDNYIDKEAERKLVWKLDLWLLPVLTLAYLACFIDRASIGNARVLGLGNDLGLIIVTNLICSAFFLPYAAVEVPSNILLKKIGPKYYLPILVLAFGLITTCTCVVRNFGDLVAIRVFLGIAEGGMMPGIAYTLSCFYRRRELLLRLGIFISGSSLSGAFGGLLAYGLNEIPAHGRLHGWRWIFCIEGILTMTVGILLFFMIPRSPKLAFFLDDTQRELAAARIEEELRHRKNENVDKIQIKRALLAPITWMCALGFFLVNITVQSFSLFLPTILTGMGYTAVRAQLLSVPPYACAFVFSIIIAYMSDHTRKRGIWLIIPYVLQITGYSILVGVSTTNVNARYGAVFLAACGAFPGGPGFLAWGTNNVASHTARAVTSGLIVSFGTLGAVVATWVYLPKDGPAFRTGHCINIGAGCTVITLCTLMIFFIKWENLQRDKGKRDIRLEKFASDDEANAHLGDLHPRFRYIE